MTDKTKVDLLVDLDYYDRAIAQLKIDLVDYNVGLQQIVSQLNDLDFLESRDRALEILDHNRELDDAWKKNQ